MDVSQDITRIHQLIDVLRAESQSDAITPENLGFLLQSLLDLDSSFNKDINPIGGNFRPLFEALPNVKFNPQTNFYEVWKSYGGLSNVTEKEMLRILLASITAFNSDCYLEGFDTRAVIPLGSLASPTMYKRAIFYWCPNLEFVALTTDYRGLKSLSGIINFAGCEKLHTVISPVSPINDTDHNDFKECTALRHIPINAKTNLYLADSPNLEFYTLNYISKFPNNSQPISVAVHQNIYNLLSGKASNSEYSATGHSVTEWTYTKNSALQKQVSFVLA